MAKGFKPTSGELEFANLVKEQFAQPLEQPTKKGFLSHMKQLTDTVKQFTDPIESINRAGVRGVLKGFQGAGELLSSGQPLAPADENIREPTDLFGPSTTEQPQEQLVGFNELIKDLIPSIPQQNEFLQPVQQFAEDVAERGGEILPFAAAGGGGIPQAFVRSTAAGVSGETAKGLGFGPVGQAIAEIPAFGSPKFGKKIIPKKSQREVVQFARDQGLSEKAIAPLLQTERKGSGLLGKFANRGKRAQEALELAREGRNTVFTNLKSLPESQLKPSEAAIGSLFEDVRTLVRELPVETGKLLENDLNKFLDSAKTQGDLAILWDAINFQFTKKGGKRLQPLKESITRVLQETSPEFAKQFELTIDLAKRFQSVTKQLTPTQASKLVEQFQLYKAPIQLAIGVSTGTLPWVTGALVSEVAGKELAREMLTNPRLQNLGGQMVTAMKKSSVALARSTWNQITREIRKSGIDQDTIDKLQDVDIEEFIETIDLSENGKKK